MAAGMMAAAVPVMGAGPATVAEGAAPATGAGAGAVVDPGPANSIWME
jgi:hypothetical protein